ncbi:hypothetical protein [Sphingobacterium daejeonense]|uniref:hypothetical protein n=1 Tax=Sphingobacterium daejeonense TaxID=371142 RepID=UPI0010C2D6A5|nr:hypothetical protein [Sphingobacterium daejeonense]VTP89055.1 Uncharacterised protein [Sphingobacterium daejeonense]
MDLQIAMDKQELYNEELLKSRKAKKFNLWLGMIGMFMMFAALTSGFIVYTASGVDKGIKTILPQVFIYSTAVIVLSSITMHLAYKAVKSAQLSKQKTFFTDYYCIRYCVFLFTSRSVVSIVQQRDYFCQQQCITIVHITYLQAYTWPTS